ALRFDNRSFDHTLSLLVLQFIPGPERAVREMCRVTRSGGVVAAATWDTCGGLVIARIVFDTAAAIDPNAMARRASAFSRPMSRKEGLARAWKDAGLRDVEVDSLTIRMEYESFIDFWSLVDGGNGPLAEYIGTLGAETKLILRRLIEAAYLDGEPDGPRSYAAT